MSFLHDVAEEAYNQTVTFREGLPKWAKLPEDIKNAAATIVGAMMLEPDPYSIDQAFHLGGKYLSDWDWTDGPWDPDEKTLPFMCAPWDISRRDQATFREWVAAAKRCSKGATRKLIIEAMP